MFKIRCKILGKVFQVIVDFGSIDNIILVEKTNKVKLVKVPHVNPYKVTWLNKGQSVLVNEKTWVEFSIIGYKETFISNILSMDACHILLGRPWQYDTKFFYDGKENSISFKKDGRTFKI